MKHRPPHRIATAVLAILWIASAQPPAPRDGGRLRLRQTVERQLGPGQADSFGVQAAAGEFFRVVVKKKGVDAALSIADPAGKTLVMADSPNGAVGVETASWTAQTAGVYFVRVTKSDRSGETGRYEIELASLGVPTDADRKQAQAEARLYAAVPKDRATERENRSAAIPLYEESAALWRELHDSYQEALCLHRIGAIHSDLGDQPKALEYYERALALRRAIGDRAGEATTLNNIGVVQNRLGDLQKALEVYQQALGSRREAGDRPGEALTLNNIAGIYSVLGEQERVLEFCQQALEARRASGDRSAEALMLANMAVTYNNLSEPQKVLESYEQALAIYRAARDRSGEANMLSSLGNMYRDLGAEEKALELYGQALQAGRDANDRSTQLRTLIGTGDVYFFLGEKQKSLDSYQQALTLARAANDRSNEALTLIGIANVYSDLGGRQKPPDDAVPGEKQKALESYQQALAAGRAIGDRSVEVFALMGAGVAASALGDKQKAMEYLNPARFLMAAARYKPGEGWAQYEIARVERDRGNLDKARTLAASARDIIESLRSKVLSPELRASFFAAVQDCYSLEMDVLMKLHAADPSKDFQAEALATSERARARVLLETLGESRANIREGVDARLLERERTVQLQLNAKEMARMQMLGARHTPQQLAALEDSVRNLAAQFEEVRTRIRAGSPRYAALSFPQPLSLKQIQTEVLDADTLLLEYALGEQRSFLWVVSSREMTGVALPKRSDIEEAARRYRDAVADPAGTAHVDAGQELSRMLLGDAASSLENKRLLIVADGALQYLPFAALPDPSASSQPLIVNHEIVNVPSASTLAVLRREVAGRTPAVKTLAVFADPVFSAEDARISRNQDKAQALGTRHANATRGVDDSLQRSLGDLGLAGFRLPRLPGTRREAAAIASLVPESSRKQALDFEASRAALTSAEMSQYRILHLATHGLLNNAHPELSGVVLSLVDRRGQPQDGFLRLHEVYNLKLSADLVVLSACQTGLGKEIQGEGLVGLTRGFMYAGSPRVLASLWKVDDRATADLMKQFYASMLGDQHARPAAALREAQIALWKTKDLESPYYWAAFVLQGDWR